MKCPDHKYYAEIKKDGNPSKPKAECFQCEVVYEIAKLKIGLGVAEQRATRANGAANAALYVANYG